MKSTQRLGTALALTCILGLVGCSKSEPDTPTAPAAASTPTSATTSAPTNDRVTSAQATIAAARESLADFKLPDFQTASVQQLSGLASQSLTQWVQAIETPSPAATKTVEAVKSALAKGQASVALSSLTKLNDYAQSIPGGEALLQGSKQLVSAWALKQGFDVAKISGVLGSLQRADYASLANEAAALFAKGGVSAEQKELLTGVLGTFGIDATQAGGAVNAVKGLFSK